MLSLVDTLPILGLLEPVAVLELRVVLREAYSTGTLQVWYLSIDMHFILLHINFEKELSISFLRNRATRPKMYEKKPNVFKRPTHFVSHPAFFKTFVEMVSSRFY
jgi:hypothetical protein